MYGLAISSNPTTFHRVINTVTSSILIFVGLTIEACINQFSSKPSVLKGKYIFNIKTGLLASGCHGEWGVRTPAAAAIFPFRAPTWGSRRPKRHQHREEGKGAADVSRRREEETPGQGSRKKRGGRWNTRSTFKTSRCNTCYIHLKADETFETCI